MDTLDMFIQEYLELDPNTPGLDSMINAQPHMKNEIENQTNVLEYLLKTNEINLSVISHIRNQSNKPIVNLELLLMLRSENSELLIHGFKARRT